MLERTPKCRSFGTSSLPQHVFSRSEAKRGQTLEHGRERTKATSNKNLRTDARPPFGLVMISSVVIWGAVLWNSMHAPGRELDSPSAFY